MFDHFYSQAVAFQNIFHAPQVVVFKNRVVRNGVLLVQLGIFAHAHIVVRKQINTLEIFSFSMASQKPAYSMHFGIIIVVSLKHGHADVHIAAIFKQPLQIGQNKFVAHAGQFIVLFRVHVLDVEQKQVNHFGQSADNWGLA